MSLSFNNYFDAPRTNILIARDIDAMLQFGILRYAYYVFQRIRDPLILQVLRRSLIQRLYKNHVFNIFSRNILSIYYFISQLHLANIEPSIKTVPTDDRCSMFDGSKKIKKYFMARVSFYTKRKVLFLLYFKHFFLLSLQYDLPRASTNI